MDGKAVWAAAGTAVRKYIRGKEVRCSLTCGQCWSHQIKDLGILESVRGICDIFARLWLTTPRFV